MEGLGMNPVLWKDRRVLVTGHTGFKGSWLSLWLHSMGARTLGYALLPPTNPSLFDIAKVNEGLTSVIGDIRNLALLQSIFSEFRPEIVFHMAAQPLVRHSYIEPVETYSSNVMGTVNLLEAVRHTDSVRVVVNVTSDKCYDNREWVWGYRENEAMGGHDPYSSSKGCAELITAAYRNSYFHPAKYKEHGVALASGRAGNVIGGGDWAEDRLIPDIMRAIMAHKPVDIRNPFAIRPWQHVLEPLSGYILLAEKLWEKGAEFAEAWNFGPNDEDSKPVEWIADRLTKLWGDNAGWQLSEAIHPHEAHHLKLDISKSRARLGWHPRWSLPTALEMTTVWYRAYQAGRDMRNLVLEQIQSYCLA